VKIFRNFSLLILPLALVALFSATLRAEGHFFAVAFGPVAVNCCIVGSLVLLLTRTGIMSYVWGWTLGILCQLVIVFRPFVTWRAFDLRLVSWKDPHLRIFAKTTTLLVLDVLSGLLLLAVERNMASALAPGTVSHINYAKLLYILPLRLVVSPVQLVMFSLFAQHFTAGRTDELKRASAKTLSLLVFLMLPTALFIMCFSSDIVQLIYERGRFTAQDTKATATLLTFYALSIPALALWWQLRLVSFTLGNVSFPLAAGILALVLFYVGNRALLGLLGAPSLALNWSIAYYVASLVLGAGLAYRYGIPFWSSLVRPLWRLFPAVLAAFGCIIAFQRFSLIPEGPDDASWVVAVRIATYGTAGLATYVAVAWAVGVGEVRIVRAMSCDHLKRFWSCLRALPKR
jgi:putative peptidoglycan lipid II flippase